MRTAFRHCGRLFVIAGLTRNLVAQGIPDQVRDDARACLHSVTLSIISAILWTEERARAFCTSGAFSAVAYRDPTEPVNPIGYEAFIQNVYHTKPDKCPVVINHGQDSWTPRCKFVWIKQMATSTSRAQFTEYESEGPIH